jgi:hypothetical protein
VVFRHLLIQFRQLFKRRKFNLEFGDVPEQVLAGKELFEVPENLI